MMIPVFSAALILCFLVRSNAYFRSTGILSTTVRRFSTQLKGAIHDAAERGDFETVVTMLTDAPDLIKKTDTEGHLPLHHAAKNGHFDLVKYLVEYPGAPSVNWRSARGRTALHYAASYAGWNAGCVEISLYLASKGSDLNMQNKDLVTPLDFAKKNKEAGPTFLADLKKAAEGVPVCRAETNWEGH